MSTFSEMRQPSKMHKFSLFNTMIATEMTFAAADDERHIPPPLCTVKYYQKIDKIYQELQLLHRTLASQNEQ